MQLKNSLIEIKNQLHLDIKYSIRTFIFLLSLYIRFFKKIKKVLAK
ncbi:hypothetical protein HMPREF3033_00028 [Veillonellaceae bacterium DNF00751]|nr:hypothetical protein HMPREF3033_00028 [Veillonellaceae bacterium DNF00751]